MQLQMILKFGSFVVLLDPLKLFLNLFVQKSNIIFTANQNLHFTFAMGSHKNVMSITALSRTCNGTKPRMSVVDTFAVAVNHLIG